MAQEQKQQAQSEQLRRDRSCLQLDVDSGAAIVVSFPKSGRTWLRVMLEAAGLKLEYSHDRSDHFGRRHFERLSHDKSAYKGRRVLFLLRDPRDTVVSGYFQATRRLGIYRGEISEFLRDPRHGIEKILVFNSSWLAARDLPKDFGLIQYEDLHAYPAQVMAQVFRFASPTSTIPNLAEIIELGRFENMQARERNGELGEMFGSILKPGDSSDPESFKCRQGKVGGYVDYLSSEDLIYCDQVMRQYKYTALTDDLRPLR